MSDNKLAQLGHIAKLRDNHFALATLADLVADSKNYGGLYHLLLSIANQQESLIEEMEVMIQ